MVSETKPFNPRIDATFASAARLRCPSVLQNLQAKLHDVESLSSGALPDYSSSLSSTR